MITGVSRVLLSGAKASQGLTGHHSQEGGGHRKGAEMLYHEWKPVNEYKLHEIAELHTT